MRHVEYEYLAVGEYVSEGLLLDALGDGIDEACGDVVSLQYDSYRGYVLYCILFDLTPEEIKEYGEYEPIEFYFLEANKMLEELGNKEPGIGQFIMKAGKNRPLWTSFLAQCEIETQTPEEKHPEIVNKEMGYAITTCLINANTGRIEAIKFNILSNEFSEYIRDFNIHSMKYKRVSDEQFSETIGKIYDAYSVEEAMDLMKDKGVCFTFCEEFMHEVECDGIWNSEF